MQYSLVLHTWHQLKALLVAGAAECSLPRFIQHLCFQGESDTDTEMKAQSFGSKLRRLITAVRWGGPLVEATSDAWASFLPEGADVLTCNVWSDRQDVGVPDLPVLQVWGIPVRKLNACSLQQPRKKPADRSTTDTHVMVRWQ